MATLNTAAASRALGALRAIELREGAHAPTASQGRQPSGAVWYSALAHQAEPVEQQRQVVLLL